MSAIESHTALEEDQDMLVCFLDFQFMRDEQKKKIKKIVTCSWSSCNLTSNPIWIVEPFELMCNIFGEEQTLCRSKFNVSGYTLCSFMMKNCGSLGRGKTKF